MTKLLFSSFAVLTCLVSMFTFLEAGMQSKLNGQKTDKACCEIPPYED